MRSQTPAQNINHAVVSVWRISFRGSILEARRDVHWQSLVRRIGARQMSQQVFGLTVQCFGRRTNSEGLALLMRRATARRQATSDASCLLAPVPLVWTTRPSPLAKLFGSSNAHSPSPEAELAEKVLHAVMDRTRAPPCCLGRVDALLFSTVCHRMC